MCPERKKKKEIFEMGVYLLPSSQNRNNKNRHMRVKHLQLDFMYRFHVNIVEIKSSWLKTNYSHFTHL